MIKYSRHFKSIFFRNYMSNFLTDSVIDDIDSMAFLEGTIVYFYCTFLIFVIVHP